MRKQKVEKKEMKMKMKMMIMKQWIKTKQK